MSGGPEAAQPTRAWGAAWRWLLSGRHGAGGFASYSGPRRHAAWGIPKRIWRVIRHRQAIQLTPIVYVIVVGSGLVIGVVLQLAFGVWWWMPAVVLLLALWIFEGSSVFWAGRFVRDAYTLRAELLAAIMPRRGVAALQNEDRARLLGSDLPFFAPVDWAGEVSLGGWGASGRTLTTVSIRCRAQEHDGSSGVELTITTDADDHDDESVRRELLEARRGARGGAPSWHPITLHIDGQELGGWGVESDGVASRYTRVGTYRVSVSGPVEVAALPLHRIAPASVAERW